MQNFIIDTSVFALSGKSEDTNIEKNNLCMLKNNIAYLRKLQYNNSVTVSYMNKILLRLRDNNYFFKRTEINSRIKELLNKNPDYQSEIGLDSALFSNWDEFLFKVITPKRIISENDKPDVIRKGTIGIFNNIPDREDDPSDDYINKTALVETDEFYKELPSEFLKAFMKYCGYIAELNYKYYSFDNNYFVLGGSYGNQEKKNITVTLNENGTVIQSRINVVGIQNTDTLYPKELKFKDLINACEEAIKKFSEKLDFGNDINNINIKNNLIPRAGPPEKIYSYLETLYNVCGLAVKENINIQNEKELVELLNSYGLLCSTDEEKYAKNKCICRHFFIKSGKKKFFNIHLKPATYSNNTPNEDDSNYTLASKGTVRIYLDWDNSEKKFVLGWIGHHPPFCTHCVNTTCQGY